DLRFATGNLLRRYEASGLRANHRAGMKMNGLTRRFLFGVDSARLEVGFRAGRYWRRQLRLVARGGFRRHRCSCSVSRKARVTGVQSRRVKATTGRTRRGLAGRVSSLALSGTM